MHSLAGRIAAQLAITTLLVAGLLAFVLQDRTDAQSGEPTVTTLAVTSVPGEDGGYAIGDTIDVTLTFSRAVTVSGAPQLTIEVGDESRQAVYSTATSATELVFRYTVVAGDEDPDGITVAADSLILAGGSISAGVTAASLAHSALQAYEHKVDGIAPTVYLGGESRTYVPPGRLFNVVFYFSEQVYDFDISAVSVTNGTAHDPHATQANSRWERYTRWDVVVAPASEGPVTVRLQAGAVVDVYGNPNTASPDALSTIAAEPTVVQVTQTTSGFAEGGDAEFLVTRTLDNGAIPVKLTLAESGDVLAGTVDIYPPASEDSPAAPNPRRETFSSAPFSVEINFAAGETSKRIVVQTDDDSTDESDGSVSLSVVNVADQYKYLLGMQSTGTAQVRDNDDPFSLFLTSSADVPTDPVEEGELLQYALFHQRRSPVGFAYLQFTAGLELLDLDSTAGAGYEHEGNGRIKVAINRTGRYSDFSVPTLENDEVDPERRVRLEGLTGSGYSFRAGWDYFNYRLRDDDAPPSISLVAPSQVTEGDSVEYILTRTASVGQSRAAMTVNVKLSETGRFIAWPIELSPAADGSYTIPVTFAANSKRVSLNLSTDDDDVPEASAQISAQLVGSPDHTFNLATTGVQTTSLDDNEEPEVSVEAVAATITEGASAQYRVTRIGNASASLRVGLYVTGMPRIMTEATEAIALRSDHEDLSQRLVLHGAWVDSIIEFAAGETEKTFSLTTEADSLNEGDGWLAVSLLERRFAPYTLGASSRAEVHVRDDDIPTVSLNRPVGPTNLRLSEDGTTWEGEISEGAQFTFSLNCAGVTEFSGRPDALAVAYSRILHSNHPAFYGDVNQNFLGQNHADLRPIGCNHTVSSSTPELFVGPDNGVVEIELVPHTDLLPISGEPGLFHTALFAELHREYQEARTAADAAGARITARNIFSSDRIGDFDSRYNCRDYQLQYCPTYQSGTVNKIRLEVINRDPTILIEAESRSVGEGDTVRFILTRLWADDLLALATPLSDTVVYLRAYQNGSYVTSALPSQVTFGQNETRKEIELETVDDRAFSEDGSVTIELLRDRSTGTVNPSGKYTTWEHWDGHTPEGGRSDRATVDIANDDDAPGLTISPASVAEGDSGTVDLEFTVSLGSELESAVQVNWITSDGTATAGVDYRAVSSGQLNIPAGEVAGTISVSVTGDSLHELDETLHVTISLPDPDPGLNDNAGAGYLVGIVGGDTATATGTIRDDDPVVVTVEAETESVDEGDDAVFVLTRTGYSGEALSIPVRLHASDNVRNVTAEFGAGESTTELSVATKDNNRVDYPSGREYTIEVVGDGEGSGGGDERYTPGDPDRATVVAEDDDELQIVTVVAGEVFSEAGVGMEFVFRRTGDISQELAFWYVWGSMTAVPPSIMQYDFRSGIFQAGESEYRFTWDPNVFRPASLPIIFAVNLYGDAGPYGLHRVWKPGKPDSAITTYYGSANSRTLLLGVDYPHSVRFGEVVDVDFSVLNTAATATGSTVTVSSVRRVGGERPDEPRIGCAISESIPAGETRTCRASFTVTTDDREEELLQVESTAKDGDHNSNTLNLSIWVRDSVSVGFEDTQWLRVREPEHQAANAKAVMTVTRSGDVKERVEVAYTLRSLLSLGAYSPVYGVDYVDMSSTPGRISFGVNETRKDITIDIIGDATEEPYERFRVNLVPPEGVLVEDNARRRVVVILDKPPATGSYRPTASLNLVSADPTPESAGAVDFSIELDSPWGYDAHLLVGLDTENNLTATPTDQASGESGDFDVPEDPMMVMLRAGETRFDFSLPLHDDDLAENDETFQLQLSDAPTQTRQLVGDDDTVLVTIADDDDLPPAGVDLFLTSNGNPFASMAEDRGRRFLSVTASFSDVRLPSGDPDAAERQPDPRADDTTVLVTLAPDSTAGFEDFELFQVQDSEARYQEVQSFQVVIPAGQLNGTTLLRFKPDDDDVDEESETVVLQGAEVTANDSEEGLAVAPVSFTIRDNDTRGITMGPSDVASLATLDVREGEAATYTLVLESEPTEAVTISPALAAPNEHVQVEPSLITFTAANWSMPRAIQVTALDDRRTDPAVTQLTIVHEVDTAGDYAGQTVSDLDVNVTNTTRSYISLGSGSASEAAGYVEFTVSISPVSTEAVTVHYSTVDDTAIAGTDYTREVDAGKTSKALTIPGSQSSGVIRIPIVDNQVHGNTSKRFSLRLTNGSSSAILAGDATVLEATGAILDDDPEPIVDLRGPTGSLSYVPEGNKAHLAFTVTLTGQSERDVLVDYSTVTARLLNSLAGRQGITHASAGEDYVATSGTLKFVSGESTKTVVVELSDDDLSEETEFVGFRINNVRNAQLPEGADEELVDVGLLDNDYAGVTIAPTSIMLAEPAAGDVAAGATYTVRLDSEPTADVTIAIGGVSDAVTVSGATLSGAELVFTAEDWNTDQTVSVAAVRDDDAIDESVTLTHTASSADYTFNERVADSVTVTVTDSDTAEIVLSSGSITVVEDGLVGTDYTVLLASEPVGAVAVTISGQTGTELELSGATLNGDTLSFDADNWDTQQTVTVRAGHDVNTVGENITLTHTALGNEYTNVTAELTVEVEDAGYPDVTASFGSGSYAVAEGGGVDVTVTLSADPERTVAIPITPTNQNGADDADYAVPSSVSFNAGETAKTIRFNATQDSDNDDGERVLLEFGTLPAGVSAGSPSESLVSISDDDVPAVTVSFGSGSYDVAEGRGVDVTVTLSADPERTVAIPITPTNQNGAVDADYTVPNSVSFDAGETSKTVRFNATQDSNNDDDERVLLEFGALPAGVSAGGPSESLISITDDDVPAVTVSFGSGSYTAAEGGSVDVTVTLSADPERTVAIPITPTNQNGAADADYTVPISVSFNAGETTKTVRFSATQDSDNDDGERVLLEFGALPAGVSEGSPSESLVSISDDDHPNVTVSFGSGSYAVAEGGGVEVAVTLSADPERTVAIPITPTNQAGAADADYAVPASVSFDAGETSKTVRLSATQDSDNDDGERVLLEFGALPAGVTAGGPSESLISITDDDVPAVTVSFGSGSYTAAEGGGVDVAVTLSADPERTVAIPITPTNQNGVVDADYTVPSSVSFDAGETSKTITFNAAADSDNDDGERVLLAFGALPAGVSEGSPSESLVSISDDDVPAVTVSFGSGSYTAAEGGGVDVTLTLSADPERTVAIPITPTNQNGAVDADYTVPSSVSFDAGEISKTVRFSATQDSDNDDGERVLLAFGALPAGVSEGSPSQSLVSIGDDDVPAVTVSFGSGSYKAAEGGSVDVTLTLSADPERMVVIPITPTNQAGAADADYAVPASVSFDAGETSKTVRFSATQDSDNDDDERVLLEFGALPAGVSAGSPSESLVSITDDDVPAVTVSFGSGSYTAAEGGSVDVTVMLSADPERTVAIPITPTNQAGAADADYAVPASVSFDAGETAKTITFNAAADSDNDDGERVLLAFGALPAGVSEGSPSESLVSISDDDVPAVTVSFGSGSYTAAEGGSVDVTVTLSADPERTVVIPITPTNQNGAADADYAVPSSVSFDAGETSKTVRFSAAQDSDNDDGERVLLEFGALPERVSAGSPSESLVSVSDDDHPAVTVSFGSGSYDVAEGGGVDVTVTLSADPERTVAIPITPTNQNGAADADYTVPASVSFDADETSKTVRFSATQDSHNDDGERVLLEFGTLPEDVSAGSPSESLVSISDDDVPAVTVSFGSGSYTAAEGGSVDVTVRLSADPERTVVIPITPTNQNGAVDADYAVPNSVSFNAGETSKTVRFSAAQDSDNDDGERVLLEFGALPAGVSAGSPSQSLVSISDDDVPAVTVSFGSGSYAVAEGGGVDVTVTLSADPERTVAIPITPTNQNGAVDADYTVPNSVSFDAGETSKTVRFSATQDSDNDDGERVLLAFGALPAGVSAGSPSESLVSISDDDVPAVTVSFGSGSYTAAEGDGVDVAVTLSADPERTVAIPIMPTNQNGAADADYAVPSSVSFNAGETSKTVGFSATQDSDDDDDERVLLEFGALPAGVSAGSPSESLVSISDDDVPAVTVSFGSGSYAVAEGGGIDVTVSLSADPERTVVIPITPTNQNGAVDADYTVPSSVSFDAGETSKTVRFSATQDSDNDDGERVLLEFGALPAGVSAGSPSESLVSIGDDDVPAVTVSFGSGSYAVAEGGGIDVTVTLSADPERTVAIPITPTNQNGAADADYTVPSSVSFDAGETAKTIRFNATQDSDNDDGERVLLEFGALPAGVSEGSPSESLVSISDDDEPVILNVDEPGDLRLVDGTETDGAGNLCEGRLEIYYDGQWGTICDDYWTKENADVACRVLGFAGGSVEDFSRRYRNLFPAGDDDQPIWLDDVQCDGGESSLMDCRSRPVGRHNCRHAEDVGLRCLKNDGPFIVNIEFNEPPGGDGSYDMGERVEVTVVWSEAVMVTANVNRYPALWLAYDGSNTVRAFYDETRSGSDRTVFTHTIRNFGNGASFPTVRVGHDSLFVGAPRAPVESGSIVSAQSGAPAVLGHRSYRSDGGVAQATGEAGRATIVRAPGVSDPGLDGVFGPGETVEISLVFSSPVEVDETGGTPSVRFLLSGATSREAQFERGSGTLQLVFSYTLADGDGRHRSILLAANALALNGGTIRDTDNDLDVAVEHEGKGFLFLDAEAPTLQSATVDGSTLTLAYNETLDSSATLSAADFAVLVNGFPRSVTGAGQGQNIAILRLSTAVVAGDWVTVSYIAPADTSAAGIQDTSGNAAASFSGETVTNNTAAANSPATGAPAVTGIAQVGEALAADTSGISDSDGLAHASFVYQWQADDADINNATGSSYTPVEADEGKVIKVRVSFTDDAGHPEVLTSVATAAVSPAPVEVTPLRATIHNPPLSHDGSSLLTFELRLSEHISLNFRTLRDHAFAVTGGAVTKARRVEQGSNLRWQISVMPGGNGTVTIVLPATTDCERDGAICNGDGRMLSKGLEFTVPGPESWLR